MAATCRGFWRASRTFSCLLNGSASFRPKITGTRTCFVAPGSLEDGETFEEMFRNSNFVKMGRPQGKLVAGRITHVVENEDSTDLYVDFGWKFHAVVTQGKEGKSTYKVDDVVNLKLKALEATGHFLGQNKRVTVCEADAELIGSIHPDTTYSVFQKEQSLDTTNPASSKVERTSFL